MVQVSGRAGRKKEQGKVLVQTRRTDHPLLQKVIRSDYEGFYRQEISERIQFKYPPVYRMIRLRLRHRKAEKVQEAANYVYEKLSQTMGSRVYPPIAPLVSRIRGQYIFDIIIKTERSAEWLAKSHRAIRQSQEEMAAHPDFKGVFYYADVDPY